MADTAVSVSFDPSTVSCLVSGGPPGPAGAAALEILSDVTLRVDLADPTRLVDCVIDLAGFDADSPLSTQAAALVKSLFGEEVVRRLVPADRMTRHGAVPVPAIGRVQRETLYRLVVLSSEASAERYPSPWWAAESAVLWHRLDLAFGLSEIAQLAATEGAKAFTELSDDDLLDLDDSMRSRLDELGSALVALIEDEGSRQAIDDVRRRLVKKGPGVSRREVEERFPVIAQSLDDLFEDEPGLELTEEQAGGGGLAPRSRSAPSDGDEETIRVLRAFERRHSAVEAEVLASTEGQVVWEPHKAEMTVSFPIGAGATGQAVSQLWARVGRPAQGGEVLVALSPFRLVGGGDQRRAEARLVVPGIVEFNELRFALSTAEEVGLGRPSEYRSMVTRAFALGADAARRARRGEAGSPDRWRECAQHWARLADVDRQALALSCAARDMRRLGHDTEAAAIEAEASSLPVTWAQPYLEPGDPGGPFITEVLEGLGPGSETSAAPATSGVVMETAEAERTRSWWRQTSRGTFELGATLRAMLRPVERLIEGLPAGLPATVPLVVARDSGSADDDVLHSTEQVLLETPAGLSVLLRLTVSLQGPSGDLEVRVEASEEERFRLRIENESTGAMRQQAMRGGETITFRVEPGSHLVNIRSQSGLTGLALRLEALDPAKD